jgi:diguanylate cyclase (GGDEF)-like protein
MKEILLILAQAVLSFALCMGAFRVRHVFGMAPTFFTLGSLEGMKYFAFAQLIVTVPYLGDVSPGSLVFYVGSLAVMQVVYAREGVVPARQLLWSMLYVMIVLSLITILAYQILILPQAKRMLEFDAKILSISSWWQIVGTVLTFLGGLFSIVLHDLFSRWSLPLILRIGLSLGLVVAADSLFFDLLARGVDSLGSERFWSNMQGKVIMAFFYAALAWAYLRFFDYSHDIEKASRSTGTKLFAALTYQTRIAELERELQIDPLTGAFNRRYIDHALPEQIELDLLRNQPTSILYLDIDHFKKINDRYGHVVGDKLLEEIVKQIQTQVRRGDSVARMGGEEFVVLMPGTTKQEAEECAHRIVNFLGSNPLLNEPEAIIATATIGIACSPQDAPSARALVKAADERLYRGKREGRSRVVSV